MKKICLLLTLLLTLLLVVPAQAAVNTDEKVYDSAGLFTPEEVTALQQGIRDIMARHPVDIVILTEGEQAGIYDSEQYGNGFYDNNGFGIGTDGDGVMLFINMSQREVSFLTTGRCEPLFRSSVDTVLDHVYDYLAEAQYSSAAEAFLRDVDRVLTAYTQKQIEQHGTAKPIELPPLPTAGKPHWSELLAQSFGIGLVLALIIMLILIGLHKRSLPKPPSYHSYLGGGSVRLHRRIDEFQRTYTHRTKIERSSSGSGGGGRSGGGGGGGGGRVHGGGSRKF